MAKTSGGVLVTGIWDVQLEGPRHVDRISVAAGGESGSLHGRSLVSPNIRLNISGRARGVSSPNGLANATTGLVAKSQTLYSQQKALETGRRKLTGAAVVLNSLLKSGSIVSVRHDPDNRT